MCWNDVKVKFYSPLVKLLPFAAIVFQSCSTEVKDCLCTADFRTVSVLVLDKNNLPVDSLVTTIENENGKIYILSIDEFFKGYYSVMTDNFVNDFSTNPTKIFFTGEKDSLEVNAEFEINTDECKCHIQKVSGPNTFNS